MIGSNEPKKKIDAYLKETTVEGLYTLKSIYKLLDHKKVNMPIINLIYNIIFNDYDYHDLLKFLIEK